MNALECLGVTKSFGPVTALAGADLVVATGGFTAVLGPSGCGKSTLLRVIAGFERADAGTVAVSGQPVVAPRLYVPPERRRVGIVPQEQALFPHMSVEANVGYGLDRGADRGRARKARIDAMLDMCGLGGLGRRMPHELSGGQQQRVALARALAPEPSVVLLDEPFASLDATLRAGIRADVAAILRSAGQTAVLVTHDQDEALSMADHVAVMREGRVVQDGSPEQVYREPADAWVAAFVGQANLVSGRVGGPAMVETVLGELALRGGGPVPELGTTVQVVVRPEQLRLMAGGLGGSAPASGVIEHREYYGHDAVVRVALADGTRLTVRALGDALPALGVGVTVQCEGDVTYLP